VKLKDGAPHIRQLTDRTLPLKPAAAADGCNTLLLLLLLLLRLTRIAS
jgi:hypothetical protein